MRLLFFGDIVGRSGRDALLAKLPWIRATLRPDCIIVNAENAAHGFGVTKKICQDLLSAGVHVITLGNHTWDQREIISYIENEKRLIRPLNYPKTTPGHGFTTVTTADGKTVLVINAMARLFMEPLDDPFAAVDAVLKRYILGQGAHAIVLDFHGEATSEKMAMGHFCDGRASLVVGTHSHIPTADAQILPHGTAYQSDAGMCGDYNSVIGMDKTVPIQRFTRKLPTERLRPAEGPATLCGVFVITHDTSGLAEQVHPVRIGGRLYETWPEDDLVPGN